MVVNLEVPREVILDRLTTRRTCSNPTCQEIYNVKSMPPAADGTCKKCGSKVVQRDDETETAILFRLETYNQKTAPLIGFYEKEGLLKNFTSLSSADTVEAVKKALKKGLKGTGYRVQGEESPYVPLLRGMPGGFFMAHRLGTA